MSLALPILEAGPQRPAYAQGPRSLSAVKLLRMSITDRCNLRCVYCMPAEGVAFDDQADLLRTEEIIAVARAARTVGVTHFKVTGGEPTIRPDVIDIVAGLSQLDARDLSLTTNGLLLDRLAQPLRRAGLHRLTLSCDSLVPEKFERIVRADRYVEAAESTAGLESSSAAGGKPSAVSDAQAFAAYGHRPTAYASAHPIHARFLRGLDAALAAGFEKLKFNVVVMGGVNDDEVADFARLTLENPWTIRFIEYMPLGDSVLIDDAQAYLVDNAIVKARIEDALGPMHPIERESEKGVGPASVFQLAGAKGRLGFISAMSKPFCETCNRLRLTARGELRSCLFDGGEVSVLDALRPTPDPSRIIDAMRNCVAMKPEVHSERGNRAMSQMGG